MVPCPFYSFKQYACDNILLMKEVKGEGTMNFFKKENGQAIVEFAIVLPLLLLIICAIIDFGWLFYNQLSLENCAREGVRYAAVNAGNSDCVTLTQAKINAVSVNSIKDSLNVSVVFSSPQTPCDGDITVSVATKIRVLTPVLGIFSENQQKDLSYSVTMKAES